MRHRPFVVLVAVAGLAIAVALAIAAAPDEPDDGVEVLASDPEASTTSEPLEAPPTTSTVPPTTSDAPATSASTTIGAVPGAVPRSGILCDSYTIVDTIGVVEADGLTEASGAAYSRTLGDVMWAHNDSRDGPRVYAVGPSGEDLGVYVVGGALAFDWEDMAAGPGPDAGMSYLYFGDVGDNFGIRDGQVTIYRVREPVALPLDGVIPFATALSLRYPDHTYNAEAIFVDPVEGDLYVVTKDESETRVYGADAEDPGTTVVVMDLIAVLGLGAEVTGADMTWDGSAIAFRGYDTVWMWRREVGDSVAQALERAPCEGASATEIQGEALAFDRSAAYITVSEGRRPTLNRVAPAS